jgi:hypothetical protein
MLWMDFVAVKYMLATQERLAQDHVNYERLPNSEEDKHQVSMVRELNTGTSARPESALPEVPLQTHADLLHTRAA